ncbi:DUF3619 family protein [Variovorax saccharolyticus]|uniref:DUF3619 family protein n=1 Tax=Variovorax saccharolyticus TaxID=3053516 RepID=UPI002576ED48|nr:DUF3619 family protein [Variovorax sp. J22R187]MDM0020232.1 DUF3619 family protein [Variovorax sp. J22R187]
MKPSNSAPSGSAAAIEEQFGRRVAARLSAGNLELSHDIGERLRAARVQAVARRKAVPQLRPAPVALSNGPAAALGGGWWTRIGSVVPLVALAAGLMAISVIQDERRTNELAEVDSALLTDDLPPAAYTDPGFAQFLKTSDAAER